MPGIAKAAASMNTPVAPLGIIDIVHKPDAPVSLTPMRNGRLGPDSTYANFVTPGWFGTYGTRIRRGRDFDARDVPGAPSTIVVNEAFVRKFLRGRDPVGATIAFERGREAPVHKTVIGVVGDAVHSSLRVGDVPIEYGPLAQLDFPGSMPTEMTISVRAASGAPMQLARGIAASLTRFNRDLVFDVRPMTEQVGATLMQERLVAILSGKSRRTMCRPRSMPAALPADVRIEPSM